MNREIETSVMLAQSGGLPGKPTSIDALRARAILSATPGHYEEEAHARQPFTESVLR
jgi:hypothetical protein